MDENLPPVYPPSPLPRSVPAPPPRRGRGWMILSLFLLLVLALLLVRDFLGAILSMGGFSSARHSGPNLQESVVADHDSRNKIALIDIDGLISGSIVDGHSFDLVTLIKDELKLAAEDDAVKAVILKVDSPGGEVMAADEISRAIANFQNDARKPVIASLGGVAASGGYYVSAPCQWIVANDLTITGSIGVILHSWNYRGLMDKIGIRPNIYKSGKFKDMLSGEKSDAEILPEEGRMIQEMIDRTFAKFKEVVAEGRKRAQQVNHGKGRGLIPEWEQYADGRILMGPDALKYGFIDQLGTFETAVKQAKLLAGIANANLIRYEQPFDLFSVVRWLVKGEPPAIKVDLGLEPPQLKFGRLYFLPPALLH